MSILATTLDYEQRTRYVAAAIARAFREARIAANRTQCDVAKVFGIHRTAVGEFERGAWANIKLGSAVRFLALFKLTIVVVPISSPLAQIRVYDTSNLRIGN